MALQRHEHAARSWRVWLIGSYIIIVVLLAALWAFSLLTPIEQTEEEQQYQSLESVASAGVALLEDSTVTPQKAARSLDASGNTRITIIDSNGTVLAESSDNALEMENHAQRPEFQTALHGGVGKDKRISTIDGKEYLYVALPADYEGEQVVIRASVPTSQITDFASAFRTSMTVALVVVVIITVLVAIFAFRRAAAPVSRLERVRTNFVANASHELKTPVAGIRLLSESIEMACEDGDTELIPVFTQRLKKESQRLQNLVTELLDLSRLENGGLAGRGTETADLLSVASTSYEGHLTNARSKGIDFIFDDRTEDNEVCKINLSPADASLLVDNLLENAINYTEEGSVTMTIATSGKNVMLRVKDTGIGVPVADQERIFERFYRVDTARSREMGGTGLGLSLVRHSVNRAGGVINLESTPGEGSTFTVFLPKAE